MLSGETAIGKYPIESIQVMNRICKEAELDVASSLRGMAANPAHVRDVGVPTTTTNCGSSEGHALRDAFAKSAIMAARETGASMIIAITRTGLTANALAKYFSPVPVMVLAPHRKYVHRSCFIAVSRPTWWIRWNVLVVSHVPLLRPWNGIWLAPVVVYCC